MITVLGDRPELINWYYDWCERSRADPGSTGR